MQRVKTPTAVAEKPPYTAEGTPGYFRSGDAVAAIPPTVPGQDWFNMVQGELLAPILATGLTPDPEDDTQLDQAIDAKIASGVAAHDESETAHPDIRALIAALLTDRYETLFIGAGAMIPSATAGATQASEELAANKINDDYLDFSASSDQSAEFSFKLPENWDRDTVKVKLHWKPGEGGATAGHYVGFNVAFGATGDGDTLDRALGAAVLVADQVLAGLEAAEHVSAASAAITVGGTLAAGKRLHCKITRDADYAGGGTTMAKKARLLGIEIKYCISGSVAAWG